MMSAQQMAEAKKDLAELYRIQQWCLRSESAPRLGAMIDLARSEPGIPILPQALDSDPWLLNCENGTIELTSGKLRAHRRDDYITKLCPTPFVAGAPCPRWDSFLEEIFGNDVELIGYVQRLMGHCLTGDVREQNLWIFWGAGANGKSTLLNVLLEVLGTDYAMKAPVDFLMTKTGNEHPTSRADLFRKRLVICVETGEGRRLDEVLAKELTGGDKVRARRMREDYWEYDPTHKLILCTNHKPTIRGSDHAIWRRVKLIPFTVTIPEERQDKQLMDRLKAEAPGILAWAVRGCLDWRRDGLGLPEVVKAATAEYKSAEDVLGQFITECCITGGNYRIRAGDLYGKYKNWADSSGEKVVTQTRFGLAIQERGFEKTTSNGVWYLGLAVRAEGG